MSDSDADDFLEKMGLTREKFNEMTEKLRPPELSVEVRKVALHPYNLIQYVVLPRGSMMMSVGTLESSPLWDRDLGGETFVQWRNANRSLWLYALVDPNAPACRRIVVLLREGETISNRDLEQFVGTVSAPIYSPSGEKYVAHVFDSGREDLIHE